VGTPENFFNMPPSLTKPCETPAETPQQCCQRAGYSIVTLNETACLANEMAAFCCQPPCSTDCGKHERGCVDMLLLKMNEYRVVMIAIATVFGVVEIIGVIFLFCYHVSSVRYDAQRSDDVLQRTHEVKSKRDIFNVDDDGDHELDELDSER
jgi:hypothetical protein